MDKKTPKITPTATDCLYSLSTPSSAFLRGSSHFCFVPDAQHANKVAVTKQITTETRKGVLHELTSWNYIKNTYKSY